MVGKGEDAMLGLLKDYSSELRELARVGALSLLTARLLSHDRRRIVE